METLTTAMNLANRFKTKLERASGLGTDSFKLLQPEWIMGTVLSIGVSSPQGWKSLLSTIDGVMRTSGIVRDASISQWKDAVLLEMVLSGWAHTRTDRNRGSPILSVCNGENADSTSVPQRVRVIPAYKIIPILNKSLNIRMGTRYDEYQLLAHFLRLSLRLGAADTGTFLELLCQVCSPKKYPDSAIMLGASAEIHSMLRIARTTLSYAQEKGFLDRVHLKKLLKPATLIELSTEFKISAADRSFDDSWTILVSLEGRSAVEALRKRAPSFFMDWQLTTTCKPQVHVVDTPVLKHCNCLLLAFTEEPERTEIEEVLERLRTSLFILPSVSMLATKPFTKDEHWIRADGMLDLKFHDSILCHHLREAIQRNMKNDPREVSVELALDDDFLSDRSPQRFVIFARQGREDKEARLTIPRQLTTILRSGFFSGHNMIFRPGVDKITVVEEICSSNQHPWKDRCVLKEIPRDLPRVFLTTNPDRLTNRAEEIDLAIGGVLGDSWYIIVLQATSLTRTTMLTSIQVLPEYALARRKILAVERSPRRPQSKFTSSDCVEYDFATLSCEGNADGNRPKTTHRDRLLLAR